MPGDGLVSPSGCCYRNAEGAWDTPDVAKTMLRTVSLAHGPQLQQLTCADGSSTLADVVTGNLVIYSPGVFCHAAVDVHITS